MCHTIDSVRRLYNPRVCFPGLSVSCRCDISVCYKPDSSADWRLRRSQTSAQIQPLNPTFCSLLCLPIVTFSGALPWSSLRVFRWKKRDSESVQLFICAIRDRSGMHWCIYWKHSSCHTSWVTQTQEGKNKQRHSCMCPAFSAAVSHSHHETLLSLPEFCLIRSNSRM